MLLSKQGIRYLNSITHEGKVLVFATLDDGGICYTARQEGFETTALSKATLAGWEDWKTLLLPDQEAADASVLEREVEELSYPDPAHPGTIHFLQQSLYHSLGHTAVANVELVSGLGHLYVFRQSMRGTLLVDRFVLDGMTNTLVPKIEVRYKRSRQKYEPATMDSLDFRDADGRYFFEPTRELPLIEHLENGWFSVLLVPTVEKEKYRWHIFAYNSATRKVELTSLMASDEGLFRFKDYHALLPAAAGKAKQRMIPGIIRRTLTIQTPDPAGGADVEVAAAGPLTAVKYDNQVARRTQDGEEQLIKTDSRVLLTVVTEDRATAALSFAVALDGTLSRIDDRPVISKLRGEERELLLSLDTLEEIKAQGDPAHLGGTIDSMRRSADGRLLLETASSIDRLAVGDLIEISGTQHYDGQHTVEVIDTDTFGIDGEWAGRELGAWERVATNRQELIIDGMISGLEKTATGELEITASQHGFSDGDAVRIINTEAMDGTYRVRELDAVPSTGLEFAGHSQIELPLDAMGISDEITFAFWLRRTGDGLFSIGFQEFQAGKAPTGWMARIRSDAAIEWGSAPNDPAVDAVWASLVRASQSGAVALDTWQHVAISKSGTTVRFYLDGTFLEEKTLPYAGIGFRTHPKLQIGARLDGVDGLYGHLAEVRLWNRALGDAEIRQAKERRLTDLGSELAQGLRLYLPLDEVVEEGGAKKVRDLSGHGRDGIVVGELVTSSGGLILETDGSLRPLAAGENGNTILLERAWSNDAEAIDLTTFRGRSMRFDGIGDHLLTPPLPLAAATPDRPWARTMSAWIKVPSSASATHQLIVGQAGGGELALGADRHLSVQVPRYGGGSTLYRDPLSLPLDTWVHVAAILEHDPGEDPKAPSLATRVRLVKDGVEVGLMGPPALPLPIAATTDDRLGSAVAVSGQRAIVGCPGKSDGSTTQVGSAYIVEFDGARWVVRHELLAPPEDRLTGVSFGWAVAIDGERAIVSAPFLTTDGKINAGAAYLFEFDGTTWNQTFRFQHGPTMRAQFGFAVAVDGDWVAIGAPEEDAGALVAAGCAYTYEAVGGRWGLHARWTGTQAGGHFGRALALHGEEALCGAPDAEVGGLARAGKVFHLDFATGTQSELVAGSEVEGWLGKSVALGGRWAIVGAPGESVAGQSGAGRVFFLEHRDGRWVEGARFATSSQAGANLGHAVAINGGRAAVAAPFLDRGSDVRVGTVDRFELEGGTWVLRQAAVAAQEAQGYLGHAIAISETWTFIGAPGQASNAGACHVLANGALLAEAGDAFELHPADLPPTSIAGFGTVAISDRWAVVGAETDDPDGRADAGSAYFYEYDGRRWVERQKVFSPLLQAGARFGQAVAIDGDWALVAAPNEDLDGVSDAGSAYLFERAGGSWKLHGQLAAPVGDRVAGARFGGSLALRGRRAIVGVPMDDPMGGTDAGSVYLFERTDGRWRLRQKLLALEAGVPVTPGRFGESVAISDERILVGAPGPQNRAYIFTFDGRQWVESQRLAAPVEGSFFGGAVAISGRWALVGAAFEDGGGLSGVGGVYVYAFDGRRWNLHQKLLAPEPVGLAGTRFGRSIALRGDRAIIGTERDAAPEPDMAGSAYLFALIGDRFVVQQTYLSPARQAGGRYATPVAIGDEWIGVGKLQGDSIDFAPLRSRQLQIAGTPLSVQFFAGQIADVRIWDRVRTVREIRDEMVLQMSGGEDGLVGNWRLGGILPGEDGRRVADFSHHGNDAMVVGDPILSDVSLGRTLRNGAPVSVFRNPQLVAVTAGAVYRETFEFKTEPSLSLQQLQQTPIFQASYWGKSSRHSDEEIPFAEDAVFTFQNGDEAGWYRATAHFVVDDDRVALLRAFEIREVSGHWTSMSVRKHTLCLESDTVHLESGDDRATLETHAGTSAEIEEKLMALERMEQKEHELMDTRHELERRIQAFDNAALLRARLDRLNGAETVSGSIAWHRKLRDLAQEALEDFDKDPLKNLVFITIDGKALTTAATHFFYRGQYHRLELEDLDAESRTSKYADQLWDLSWDEAVPQGVVLRSGSHPRADLMWTENVRASSQSPPPHVLNENDYQRVSVQLRPRNRQELQVWKLSAFINGYVPFPNGAFTTQIFVSDGRPLSADPTTGRVRVLEHGAAATNFLITPVRPDFAYQEWRAYLSYRVRLLQETLTAAVEEKLRLEQDLVAAGNPVSRQSWITSLQRALATLRTVQGEISQHTTPVLAAVSAGRREPRAMLPTAQDDRGLGTRGALLELVQPSGDLHGFESAEGVVSLDYFDRQGRMRQTRFDVTADSRNQSFEEWIPDKPRACLAFHQRTSDQDGPLIDPAGSDHVASFDYVYTTAERLFLPKEVFADVDRELTLEFWARGGPDVSRARSGEIADAVVLAAVSSEGEPVLTVRLPNADQHVIWQAGGGDRLELPIKAALYRGTWNHWAFTKNAKSGAMKIYVNGELAAVNPQDAVMVQALQGVDRCSLGGPVELDGSGGFWQGQMAELRIWSSALGAEEIEANSKGLLSGGEPGLLAYYPMSEAEGTLARDHSGNRHHLAVGAAMWRAGTVPVGTVRTLGRKLRRAVSLLGGDRSYTATGIAPYTSYTKEAWIKRELAPDTSVSAGYVLVGASDRFGLDEQGTLFAVNNDSGIEARDPAGALPAGGWAHVAVSFDYLPAAGVGTLRLYRDGVLIAETSQVPPPQGTSVVHLAGGASGSYFRGALSEVRLWNRALEPGELRAKMYSRLESESGLLGAWPLDVKGVFNRVSGQDSGSMAALLGDSLPVRASGRELGTRIGQFIGSTIYRCPNLPSYTAYTKEAWVRRESNSIMGVEYLVFGQRNDALGLLNGGILYAGNNGPAADVYDHQQVLIPEHVWTHVAVTYDHDPATASGQMVLYKNGRRVFTTPAPVPFVQSGATGNHTDVYLGGSSDGSKTFWGQLAEARLWSRALSEEEIRRHMYQRLHVDRERSRGLIGYWPLDGEDVIDLVSETRAHEVGYFGTTDSKTTTLPIAPRALLCGEYSKTTADEGGKKTAVLQRFWAYPDVLERGAEVLAEKRVEELELKWIGNVQLKPTLLGFIEGAPPVPSENLTVEGSLDYNGATSVELTVSEDTEYRWESEHDAGTGKDTSLFLGTDTEIELSAGLIVEGEAEAVELRAGPTERGYSSTSRISTAAVSLHTEKRVTDRLELRGNPETGVAFPHLGQRFVPKNVGYALVTSGTGDVFISRLKRSRKMLGYSILPTAGVPLDVNTITFLINPAYTMNGSLDGLVGSSPADVRFFRQVPEMRRQFGSAYPSSYFRVEDAYRWKTRITELDKARQAYFDNLDVRNLFADHAGLKASFGDRVVGIVEDLEDIIDPVVEALRDMLESFSLDFDDLLNPKKLGSHVGGFFKNPLKSIGGLFGGGGGGGSLVSSFMGGFLGSNNPMEMIEALRNLVEVMPKLRETLSPRNFAVGEQHEDLVRRVNAVDKLEKWQRSMAEAWVRQGKRNIVNTYVWDADGGLHTESQQFADLVEHSVGSMRHLESEFGKDGTVQLFGFGAELQSFDTVHLTQVSTKTESKGKGVELAVDLSGMEGIGVTDSADRPLIPGEKVDRYRFMSFFLENSVDHFHDFKTEVVDPEWLASNDEEARALRQALANPKPVWRIFHRVTHVERPALSRVGEDMRLPVGVEERPWWYASVNTIQGVVDEIQGTTADLEADVATMSQTLDGLALGSGGDAVDLTPIQTQLTTLEGTTDSVHTGLDRLTTDVTALASAHQSMGGDLATLRSGLDTLGQTVGTIGQAVSGLAAEHTTVRGELDQVQTKLDQILAALADGGGVDPRPTTEIAGLVLHLPLNEITGGKVADLAENPLVGTVEGDPKIVSDAKFGKCLRLDGAGDAVTVPDHTKIRLTSYSVAVWMKPNGAPNESWKGIVGKPGRNYNLWLKYTGYVHHRFHDQGGTNRGAPDTPAGMIVWNEWNHVVITNDGATAKTYVNGVEKASGPLAGPLIDDHKELIIGRRLDGQLSHYFNGDLAHVRIYNRALMPDEVKKVME